MALAALMARKLFLSSSLSLSLALGVLHTDVIDIFCLCGLKNKTGRGRQQHQNEPPIPIHTSDNISSHAREGPKVSSSKQPLQVPKLLVVELGGLAGVREPERTTCRAPVDDGLQNIPPP